MEAATGGCPILAIDTSGPICTVALSDGEGREWELHGERPNDHAEVLTPSILALCERAGFPMSELRAIAVCQGPGSYTGLRIGYATVKGLAYSLQLPMVGVPLLEAMVATMRSSVDARCESALFLSLYATRSDRVYAGIYNADLCPVYPAALYVEAELMEALRSSPRVVASAVGGEVPVYLRESSNISILPITAPSGRAMLDVARGYYERECFADLAYSEPFYVMEYTPGKSCASPLGATTPTGVTH